MENIDKNNSQNRKINQKKMVDPPKQGWGQLYKNPSYDDFNGFSEIPFTMNIDTLHLMGFVSIKESIEDEQILEISNDVVLLKEAVGTPMFKSKYDVYFYGEEFGKILAHPRSLKNNLKETSAALQVNNNVLYRQDWHESLMQVLNDLDYTINNVTKLDIAMDGLNYLPDFLNAYSKQEGNRKKVKMVGRGTFAAKVLDKERMYYKNFQVGSLKSDKQITVYDKTSELKVSQKQYIRDYWWANGLRPGVDDEVWRVELRMRSKYLKYIKDFNIDACTNTKYLFNLFKTGCHNFFEFTFSTGDKNISRETKIKLLPYQFRNCELLEKTERDVSDGTYKAKMTIHSVVRDCLMGRLKNQNAGNGLAHMKKYINLYKLERWYFLRLDTWIKLYNKLNPESKYYYPELESMKLEEGHTFHL